MTTKYLVLTLALVAAFLPVHARTFLDRDICRQMALDNSEAMKEADNNIAKARLDIKIANTARLPKIEGSATALYMTPDIDMMGSAMQIRGMYLAGLQLTQPIYAGGRITAGRNLAKIGSNVADQQKLLTRADIIVEADNAYWTYIAVLDKLRLMNAYKNMMDSLYQQVETSVDAGFAIGNDMLRVEAKRSEIEYQCKKVENGAELCRMALCNAIGISPDADIYVNDSIPAAAEPQTLTDNLTQRPDYRLLLLQEEAAAQQLKLTRGDFLPSAGLSLGYTYYGNLKMKGQVDVGGGNYIPFTQKFQDGIGMGVISVSIPLFHWGEGIKKVKKARIEIENARLETQRISELMQLEARQAATNLNDGWNMIQSAKKALDQASENLRVMQDLYDEGVSTLTDLLDAQTQWQQARSNMIEANTQYQIYHTAWLKASGNL